MPTTMADQVQLEKRMKQLGRERMQRQLNRAAEAKQFSLVGGGLSLLKQAIIPLGEAITEKLKAAGEGRPQAHLQVAPQLAQVEATTAAYLTASSVIDHLPTNPSFTHVAHLVGRRVEDEVRFGLFRAEHPALYNTLMSSFKAAYSQSEHYRRRVLVHYAKAKVMAWRRWTKAERIHLGSALIDLMIKATGLVRLELEASRGSKRRTSYRVTVTDEGFALLSRVNIGLALRPEYLPTVVPPKPWDTPEAGAGGYHFIRRPLVKAHSRAYQEELAAVSMPDVLGAVNALQETAFRVNRQVLDVVLQLWHAEHDMVYVDEDGGEHLPLVPRLVEKELPPLADGDLDEDELKAVKTRRAMIHRENLRRRRKVLRDAGTVRVAQEFSEAEELYFPHQLDFRGRMYPLPAGLSPQGDGLAKGLLQFATGKALGADGVEWLAIHGANSFGIDKVPFEERSAWVDAHTREILASASAPLENRWWMAADSPFVFLAFCFEWQQLTDCIGSPDDFPSFIPVSVDGSCNGLQHFSAMLRDPVGGAAVNLVPDERPHDVYGEVLAVVTARLESMLWDGHGDQTETARAVAWLDSGLLIRDLVKRPTMTLPYGCTRKGIEGQIMEDVVGPALAQGQAPFPDDKSGWKHVTWLAAIVWDAMVDVVTAAPVAMAWLQQVAAACAKQSAPVTWNTPLGFPVRHYEVQQRVVQINTVVGGKRIQLYTRADTDKANVSRMKLGVAPHFVHSLDATHLSMTVVRARDLGVEAFAMVHDSFGTHAADVALLGEILRDTFIHLYKTRDPLAELAAACAAKGIEVPPPPRKGELDIEAVRFSPFFFA